MDRTLVDLGEVLAEGGRHDALGPDLASNPVTEQTPAVVRIQPRDDVADDHVVYGDGPRNAAGIDEDALRPVFVVLGAIAGRKCRHFGRHRIGLVLVEDVYVAEVDGSYRDHGRNLLASAARKRVASTGDDSTMSADASTSAGTSVRA